MTWTKWLVAVGIGAAAGVGIHKATKIKQDKARKAGVHVPYGSYEAFFKRPLDLLLSVMALVVLSPVIAIIAILVRVNLGSPVFFKQERPGRIDPKTGKEKIFTLYKFRTMNDKRGADGQLLPDAERITPFGSALRASSGDELGELLNIVKGDMAIVGPRPLLVRYLPAYTEQERHRHDVRPGLTGLAQISGRNMVKWDQRLAYDVEYVNKITFLGDVKIILQTVKKVFAKEDVAVDPESVDEGYLDQIRKSMTV